MDGKLLTKDSWQQLPTELRDSVDHWEQTRELLTKDQQSAETKLRRLDNAFFYKIANIALSSKNEVVQAYARALLHQQCGQPPDAKNLGYTIANSSTKGLKKRDAALINLICCFFDKSDYVFSHTKYDEMSDDFYFRRS